MSLSIEKQSLEAHVDLCAERYAGLKDDLATMSGRIEKLEEGMTKRMDKLESSVTEIKDILTKKETSALRSLITIGLAIIASLIGTVGGLVWYVVTH
jgi:predicted  nucleic acid-binding Zn-ribbon protein